MSRILMPLALLAALAACGSSGATPEEVAALQERVAELEDRLGDAEGQGDAAPGPAGAKAGKDGPGGKAGKGPARGGRAGGKAGKAGDAPGDDAEDVKRKRAAAAPLGPPPQPEKLQPLDAAPGQVEVADDAPPVVLMHQRKKYPVPGPVPAGDYTIVATFDEGKPVSAGSAHVPADGTVRISCDRSKKSCSES